MLRVGIDVSPIIYGRGVSRYTSNLVTALLKSGKIDLSLYGCSWRQKAELEAEVQKLIAAKPRTPHEVQAIPPTVQNVLWNWLKLNHIRSTFPKLDVFHSWDWLQPPDPDLPLVSTIHDLAILHFPETAHPQIKKMHERSWEILKQRQAHIIAVSRATQRDVIELLGFPPERVHVVYEALPVEHKQVSESLDEETYTAIQTRLGLVKPYILFVGTREPRKNLSRLIEAWEPLAADFDLIVAGERGWDETTQLEARAQDGLRFLGRVSEAELAVLYGEAEVFAYPCLYEGFGLPILEAFYHGTPVLTSSVSSMVEVAGNAAELVDPESVSSIRGGLERLLGESLPEQQRRLQKMIIRLQMFNWRQVADQTAKVYQHVIDSLAS